ncbi:MAG: ribokinase [Candidatus Cryosericum sp.]
MVISFGSINMDLVVLCDRLPVEGETLVATGWLVNPGGKGANQAVQSARMGAETVMVGRVGEDSFGQQAVGGLGRYGVEVQSVAVDPAASTGVACILVEPEGENRIVVVPGANGDVGLSEVATLQRLVTPGAVVMLQCEVPFSAVREAARIAHAKGATVLLDPSPWQRVVLEPHVFEDIDYLTPNEHEAQGLSGTSDLQDAARRLRDMGARTVIIKRGAEGVLLFRGGVCKEVPAFAVTAIDTTAAGDSFQGALAASLNRGLSEDEAVMRAVAAGALTVTRRGAQQSMPDEAEVTRFLRARSGDVVLGSEIRIMDQKGEEET